MRSSTVVAIALVAAAGPALAAPTWSKRQTTAAVDQSGAISTSEIGEFVNIGNDVLDGAEKLKTLITGHSKREPQVAAPAASSAPSASSSAAPSTVSSITGAVPMVITMDQSGAISASEVGDFVKIGNDVLDGAEKLKTLITGNSKRSPQAPTPSASVDPSVAPSVSPSGTSGPDPMSAAIALGTIAKVASGLDAAINGFSGSNSQRRSEALSLGDATNAAKIFSSGADIFSNLIGTEIQRRDYQMQVDPTSGAISFGSIADLIGDGISGIESLFGGDSSSSSNQRRAYQMQVDPTSGAISFGSIADLIGDGISGIESLFGGGSNGNQRRDYQMQIDPTSGAISFGSIAKIIGDGLSGLDSLFGGDSSSSDSSNQRRDYQMQVNPTSGAISLSTIGTIAKVVDDGLSGLESLFGGDSSSNQRRSYQVQVDPTSGALSLGSAGGLAKIIGDGVSGLDTLFNGDNSNNNNQRRSPFTVLPGQTAPKLPHFNLAPGAAQPVFLARAARSIADLD